MKKAALICVLTLVFNLLTGNGAVLTAPTSYVVRPGDCLWTIANTQGVTVDQIKQLNGLSSELLQVGQVLKLVATPAPTAQTALSPAAAAADTNTYVVQSGDNLWNIASTHGMTVGQIKQLNGMNSDFLQIGQVLKIAATAPSSVTPTPEAATTVTEPPAPSVTDAAEPSLYVIQPGDSLWSIAQLYGTTAENLKSLNGLVTDALFAGDTLKVTGTPAAVSVSRSGDGAAGARVLAKAEQYLGTPYKYGGAAPGGFDCSGFTSYIFKQFGISLSRTAAGQYGQGVSVSQANLVPGDLVFFNTYGGVSHVGIYAGGGRFIHSSSPRSGGVIYSALSESYYASRYLGARRVLR